MTEPVRWGILGASRFAREQMAPAIHMARGAELAALATSDPAKAEGFLDFAPRMTVHDSYDALLADPTIEAVYIPLPNHLHVEWSLKAVAAGKHVLCEKPMAMKASEYDALIKARDDSGLVVTEAYMIVHHPQWQRARELVRGGAIGRLLCVDGFFSYDNSGDPGNIRNLPEAGGGSLPDIGVYTCGSTRFVTGEEPVEVAADIVWENGLEVTTYMRARFPSFPFQAVTSMRMHPRQEMTFHGTDGIVRIPAPFNARLFGEARVEIHRNGGRPASVTVERFTKDNHYEYQVEAFGRAVRGGEPLLWTLEDARGTQRMLDMAWAAGGRG